MFGDREATANGMSRAGKAEIISGRTGAILRTHTGMQVDHGFGAGVVALGDIDGDGVRDYAITAYIEPIGSPFAYADGFWAYSGATGALLLRVPPPPGTDRFPSGLLNPGDLDGDGLDDILVSDSGPSQLSAYAQIDGYSLGPSGPNLFTLHWNQPPNLDRYLIAEIGDLDGDGYDDVLTSGYGGGPAGFIVVYSGRDLSVLQEPPFYLGFGNNRAIGDVNGDDFPDFLVGPSFVTTPSGQEAIVQVWSGAPDGVQAYGTGCPDARGIVPRIGASYTPALGATFGLNLSRCEPGAPAVLLIGNSNNTWAGGLLPFDLGPIGLAGCDLLTAPDLVGVATTTGPTDKGRATFRFDLPSAPHFAGATFFAQWLVFDVATGSATRGLEVTVL